VAITDFVNITDGGKLTTNSGSIFSHYANCEWYICQD